MAFNNMSGGDRKLYWPNIGDPWSAEEIENYNAKLDHKIIRVIQTTVGFTELNIGAGSGNLMWVVTDRALQDPDARFAMGESIMRSFTALNGPFPPGQSPADAVPPGREVGFVHLIDFDLVAPSFLDHKELGLGAAGGPPEGWVEFGIWEKDSQAAYFKIDSWPLYVQVIGPP